MKRVIISGISIFALLLASCAIWYVISEKKNTDQMNTMTPVTLPASQAGLDSATAISVAGADGTSIETANFIIAANTVKDTQNDGQYFIVQSSTSCYPDCTQKNIAVPYDILFNVSDNTFTISLLAEPLGSARISAEQYLMHVLNVSKDDMCNLRYVVSTTSYVNPTYGGTNLGFSFCPNAVKLP